VDLIKDKQGICFQFAYLYHVLLELNGIPNRIAFGYYHHDGNAATEIVNHVWNELSFDGKLISVDASNKGGFGGEKYKNLVTVYTTDL
jgi:transglutaminase-like putative cysteine protease